MNGLTVKILGCAKVTYSKPSIYNLIVLSVKIGFWFLGNFHGFSMNSLLSAHFSFIPHFSGMHPPPTLLPFLFILISFL